MSGLARRNDNLFTTLYGDCAFECELGWVHLRFIDERLAWLSLESLPRKGFTVDSSIRDCFLEWVAEWSTLSSYEQWSRLHLAGTAFQRSVWRALLDIPFANKSTYGSIAVAVGRPSAARAVGSAVGANPVSVIIPCHRVLPSTGRSGNYRWGAGRKRMLLEAEQVVGTNLRKLFR